MRKRDYSDEIPSSEVAWETYRCIDLDIARNPTRIAEEIDTTTQTVSNYLGGLIDRDLVEKAEKEGRKQMYDTKDEGIFSVYDKCVVQIFYLEWAIEDSEKTLHERLRDEFPSGPAQMEWDLFLENFIELYTHNYISSNESSTFCKMYSELFDGIERILIDSGEEQKHDLFSPDIEKKNFLWLLTYKLELHTLIAENSNFTYPLIDTFEEMQEEIEDWKTSSEP